MMLWNLRTVSPMAKNKRRVLLRFCSSVKAKAPQTHQRVKGSRRFYEHVSVSEATKGKWQILLDNKVRKSGSL